MPAQTDEAAGYIEAPVAEEVHVPVVRVEPAHYERELEPGVPMPVAADPTVPDPTSVAPSPRESVVVASAEVDLSSRSSSISGGILSRGRSPSGLFTPLTADNSRPPSPNLRSADFDKHFESPLKHAVTAEQLVKADDAETPSSTYIQEASVQPEDDNNSVLSTQPLVQSAKAPTEDLDDFEPVIEPVAANQLDELNLEYPSDTEEPTAVFLKDNQWAGGDAVPDGNTDVGVDGDVDPDHAPSVAGNTADDVEVVTTTGPAVEVLINDEAVVVSTALDGVEDTSDLASEESKNDVPSDDGSQENAPLKQDGDGLYVILLGD